ncbi:MAG TPA: hypothetical protein VF119_06895, partial [Candidatus Limnocylindrales bacterium]
MPRPAPSPDRSARRRRSLRAVVGIGVVVGFAVAAGMPAATRAQPVLASALEAFRLDMAWLRPRADGTPRILVVDMAVPGPLAWRVPVAVLEREPTGSWVPTAEAELRIPDASLRVERPWLVGLDPDAFALVAPSEEAGRTTTIGFEIVDDGGGAIVHERWRTTIEEVVDDGGSADVDADGRPELVLGSARTLRQAGVCQGSSLWVVDARVGTTRAADIADVRLAAGVIGRFDLEPGDDLAAYAYPNCPAGPDDALEARLLVVRLADGTTSFEVPVARSDAVPWLPPPVRLDADGDGRHELLAQGPRGLMVFDAASDDTGVRVATQAAIPLGAMPSSATTPARVAWLEPAIQGRGSIGTELVRRDADGAFRTGPATVMWDPGEPSDRWVATIDGAVDGALGQTRPATVAAVSPDGTCDDLIVPLAIVRCGGTGLDLGPAWLGTRPLGLLATPDARRLLVASGTEWTPGAGPPAVPAPWTRGSDGRWRHGASPLFLLAEVDERDLVSGLEAARPNLDRTAHPGPVARLGAQRGVRLLTTVAARSDTALEPREPTLLTALGTPIGRLSEAAVLRISADASAPS